MRARRLAALALLVAAGPAAGCLKRSAVARTFILDPLPAAAAETPPPAPVALVGVERVDVPDWLDRPQVTGRSASGEVVADEFSRWGEPLPRGVQRVVAENLVVLLPDRRVVIGAVLAARPRRPLRPHLGPRGGAPGGRLRPARVPVDGAGEGRLGPGPAPLVVPGETDRARSRRAPWPASTRPWRASAGSWPTSCALSRSRRGRDLGRQGEGPRGSPAGPEPCLPSAPRST